MRKREKFLVKTFLKISQSSYKEKEGNFSEDLFLDITPIL